ncbi:hypothetical protein [Halorarum halobium]|uniref:hypothetical protein n=1 Tax=Halorarum halobium TaxID=3075121 RepID=UPI0028AD6AE3|nr:hypothetical protein [Halobaculum sp. XH14]
MSILGVLPLQETQGVAEFKKNTPMVVAEVAGVLDAFAEGFDFGSGVAHADVFNMISEARNMMYTSQPGLFRSHTSKFD